MRVDEWLVKMGYLSSRTKANRFIRKIGVQVNKRQCNKPAYIVKNNDEIILNENKLAEYDLPLGYQKLKFLVNQADIQFFPNDHVLDIGASAGGFCEFLLEQNIKNLYAIEISPQFEPYLELLKREKSNFSYHINDVFDSLPELSKQNFNLVTIDLTIDPLFLLDKIISLLHLARSNENPARVICIIKIENHQEIESIIQKYHQKIVNNVPQILKLSFIDSLVGKKEKVLYIEFWTKINRS